MVSLNVIMPINMFAETLIRVGLVCQVNCAWSTGEIPWDLLMSGMRCLRLLYFDELRLLFCLPKPFIYKSLRIFTLLSTSPPPLSEWLEKKQRNDSSYQRRYALFKIAYRWAEITFLSSKVIDVKDVKHIKITQHSPHPLPLLFEWLE